MLVNEGMGRWIKEKVKMRRPRGGDRIWSDFGSLEGSSVHKKHKIQDFSIIYFFIELYLCRIFKTFRCNTVSGNLP